MPPAMSAIETPTFDGVSGVPVMDRSPTSLWTSRSYAFLRRVGTGRSVAGQAADDQPGIRRAQRGRVPSPSRSAAPGARFCTKTSARSSSRARTLPRFGPFHIERQRFLRAVQPDEMARQSLNGGVVAAREIAIARPLDLDDPRAEIRELSRRKRHRHGLFERDHGDPGERQRRCRHRVRTIAHDDERRRTQRLAIS